MTTFGEQTHRVAASRIRDRMKHWKWYLTVEEILNHDPQPVKLLNRQTLEQSLELGTRFLLNHQYPAGSFTYEYDWKTSQAVPGDSEICQAALVWALSQICRHQGGVNVVEAIERALTFYEQHSRRNDDGGRYIVYPGKDIGATRTVALLALAHVELLETSGSSLPDDRAQQLRGSLHGYLQMLVDLRRDDGSWYSRYQHSDGNRVKGPAASSDGAALLAWIRATRYLDGTDFSEPIVESVKEGRSSYIRQALMEQTPSDTFSNYYPWFAEILYELANSGWPSSDRMGDLLLNATDQMIDVWQLLKTPAKSSGTHVGMVHAYRLATERDEESFAHRIARTIDKGLARLTSWQIAGPSPNQYLTGQSVSDEKALGGFQKRQNDSVLRLATTARQLQAVTLALKYVYDH